MANPFDLHTVLLAKHAQHVVLIHFPIALFITGVALDLLFSGGKPESSGRQRATFNLTAAANQSPCFVRLPLASSPGSSLSMANA